MRVSLITPWGTACGIAEHSALLKRAVEAADPGVELVVAPFLDPQEFWQAWDAADAWRRPALVHLNYHAALHSRWTPEQVRRLRALGMGVVVTYHDTGVPNTEQCLRLADATSPCPGIDTPGAFVVHEPCEADLPEAIYWRQGVPDAQAPYQYDAGHPLAYLGQPVLGSVGFPFPWKNFDLLAEATAEAGWALVLLAPTASPEQVARWQGTNPYTLVRTDFVPREAVVAYLSGCDATAFLYTCANAGTSGAIRQGLAARKPVLASPPRVCRQFRDLGIAYPDAPLTWVLPEKEAVVEALRHVRIARVDPGVVALAEQDSWRHVGGRYAALYRRVHEETTTRRVGHSVGLATGTE